MNSEVDADIQTLVAELKQLRDDFLKLGETLKGTAQHTGAAAADTIQDQGERLYAEARSRARQVAAKVEADPITSALTALGIGFVIGWMFSGRR